MVIRKHTGGYSSLFVCLVGFCICWGKTLILKYVYITVNDNNNSESEMHLFIVWKASFAISNSILSLPNNSRDHGYLYTCLSMNKNSTYCKQFSMYLPVSGIEEYVECPFPKIKFPITMFQFSTIFIISASLKNSSTLNSSWDF